MGEKKKKRNTFSIIRNKGNKIVSQSQLEKMKNYQLNKNFSKKAFYDFTIILVSIKNFKLGSTNFSLHPLINMTFIHLVKYRMQHRSTIIFCKVLYCFPMSNNFVLLLSFFSFSFPFSSVVK